MDHHSLSSSPLRYSRAYVVEGEPYAGYDRHNAEVAAFHLDRCVPQSKDAAT